MESDSTVLGEKVKVMAISLTGNVGSIIGMDLINSLISKIGMTKAPGESLCRYPLNNGKGGFGYTYFQPITESFMIIDSWPDLNGAYLFICSCMPFDVKPVFEALKEFNLESHQCEIMKLGIK